MRSRINLITSTVLTIAVVLSSFSFVAAFPDEGMYVPEQIAKLPLKQKGLKISPLDIYNPKGGGISNAIISLSIGCTAEFVSPQGLILTNHHCGFDALVAASTADKDYGKDGYKADSMAQELPAKGYSLTLTQRIEDVTAKITKGTEKLSGDELAQALKANVDKLQEAEQAKAPEGTTIRIQALNNGFFYYLYETSQIKDIRVVYAPPQMIGFYGGDPDNFEWTRHTGDFTFLRAYVGADGKPAEYSPNNVPYKPKKFLTVSLNGIKENDFVFVMGFPGGTTRYRESQFVQYSQDVNFPFLAGLLTAWGDALRMVGAEDESKRVALQGEVANLDNSRKAYEGAVVSLKRSDFVDQRRAEEAKFAAWVNQNAQRKAKYGDVLANLDSLSKDYYAVGARDRLLRTFPIPGAAPVYKQILDAVTAVRAGRKLDDKKRAEIDAAYKEREPLLEFQMIKYFLKAAADLPNNQKFQAAENLFGRYQGKARRDAEEKFARSIAYDKDFNSAEDIYKLYDKSFNDLKDKYPDIVALAAAQADERAAFGGRFAKFNAGIDHNRLLYQQGMAEMKKLVMYPDANFTMRFTYGSVKGYKPREAVTYSPFTTLKGVIEKDTGVFPFDVPAKLKQLQKNKDFGRYGVGDSVPVNFMATTDIIGGNSGSPIMNGNGEQVGIVFDGNFEGLGNDIFFDGDYNRTIAVDIRYVLFVTDKFANAGWILKEMNLKQGAAKAAGVK
ncbi:MAG: S46 family peptidase [Acidobacteria bacterium]|nr:S46 family peptidase [Acidobacteriota bacterium]